MNTLEATVEIIKALVGNEKDSSYQISDEEHRKSFLKGIEELYKKLDELDNQK